MEAQVEVTAEEEEIEKVAVAEEAGALIEAAAGAEVAAEEEEAEVEEAAEEGVVAVEEKVESL